MRRSSSRVPGPSLPGTLYVSPVDTDVGQFYILVDPVQSAAADPGEEPCWLSDTGSVHLAGRTRDATWYVWDVLLEPSEEEP